MYAKKIYLKYQIEDIDYAGMEANILINNWINNYNQSLNRIIFSLKLPHIINKYALFANKINLSKVNSREQLAER